MPTDSVQRHDGQPLTQLRPSLVNLGMYRRVRYR